MIIVRLKGGLGNQMFQYAAGRALADQRGVPLLLDTSWYEDTLNHQNVKRSYDLDSFRIIYARASENDMAWFGWPKPHGIINRLNSCFYRRLYNRHIWVHDQLGYAPKFSRLGRNVFLEGYFQHPLYFEHISSDLRRELVLRDDPPRRVCDFAARLRLQHSVCIQVRRTDFVVNTATAKVHDCLRPDYYRKAWMRILEHEPKARGYVFTDDPEWAQIFFSDWEGIELVSSEWDGPSYLYKFYLMSACRHFIIANSTWGWWAAWLGSQASSRIIVPAEWVRGKKTWDVGLALPGWEVV